MMNLKILQLKSEGLRCPDMQIDFGRDDSVILLQMPNGTGKTTLLDMIRAALTGGARDWKEDEVRRYQNQKSNKSEGKFEITLLVDDKKLTFEVTFDFVGGKAVYGTTWDVQKTGWYPPSEIRRFLDPEFIHLFIFDGEFASRLLKPQETEAERAIDALCQLYLFNECVKQAEELWEASTTGIGAKTTVGLSQWKNKEKRLKESLDNLRKRYDEAKKELAALESEISKLSREIEEVTVAAEKYTQELEKLKEKEQKAEEHVKQMSRSIMEIIRRPHETSALFKGGLIELKMQLDRVRLPPSTSKQFFDELAQEERCICGRPIDESARDAILQQAGTYLGEEISGVLNALKADISSENRISGEFENLRESASKLSSAVEARDIAVADRRTLELQSLDVESREKYALLEKLKEEKKGLDDLIESMDAPAKSGDDENTFSLTSLEEQYKKAKKRVAEISNTVKLRKQIDVFKTICESAKQHARESIKEDLIKECNYRLESILAKVPVRVAKIGHSLELEGQQGASVGQTLAVGYTFLANLLNRGQHNFPLVVDSPANPIDISVRREIGSMVPQLCKQFLAFTISSEREGFVTALAESSNGKIRYLTLFRRTKGTKDLEEDLPEEGIIKTENGLLVEGKEYFEKFDMDKETEDE